MTIFSGLYFSRSPITHIVGPWVIDSIDLNRDLRTGTQSIGNWASRVTLWSQVLLKRIEDYGV